MTALLALLLMVVAGGFLAACVAYPQFFMVFAGVVCLVTIYLVFYLIADIIMISWRGRKSRGFD